MCVFELELLTKREGESESKMLTKDSIMIKNTLKGKGSIKFTITRGSEHLKQTAGRRKSESGYKGLSQKCYS